MKNIISQRRAFTLVEMLIVMFIIIAVAGIFVPIILNLTDRNQVPKSSSMLENALSLAKARAVAEKRPNGIRLVVATDQLRTTTTNYQGFAWYDEIQYIEDPGDYVEHWVWGLTGNNTANVLQPFWSTTAPAVGPAAPSPGAVPLGVDVVSIRPGPYTFPALVDALGTTASVTVNRQECLFGPISIIAGANQWTANTGTVYRSQRLQFSYLGPTPVSLQPGDKIEVSGVGELFSVLAVSTTNVDISIAPSARIFVPIIVLDRALPQDVSVPLNGRPNYRVIRQPRTISSLPPMKLPQDVVIDLTPSRQAFLGTATGDFDNSPSPSIYMSGVSTGINISGISGITVPPAALSVAPDYVDIMFSPSGELIPTAQGFRRIINVPPNTTFTGSFSVGASGLIALWLHQRGDANLWAQRQITAAQGNADNQAIVAINGRTGFIGSYPVNRQTADPIANARLGRARSSSDTGP